MIKQQKAQEAKLKEEKIREKEEKLFYEQQYNNIQEEVEENREIIKELRQKYKGALEEIKDLEHENEFKHAEILEDLRTTQQELRLFQGMVEMLLNPHEI